MNRYCIWFVTPDDPATRRAEVVLESTIHNHQMLEDIEARVARDCGLSTILITHWQRFEAAPATRAPESTD